MVKSFLLVLFGWAYALPILLELFKKPTLWGILTVLVRRRSRARHF